MTTDRRGLTPLFWAHVLPYGEVHLDMTTRLTLTNGGRQTLREEETPGKEDQMLSEALAALAATGGTALVGAMATDAWQTARDRVLRLFGRAGAERQAVIQVQLDSNAALVQQATNPDQARPALVGLWQMELARLLTAHPDAEADVRALVDEVQGRLPTGQRALIEQNITASAPGAVALGAMFGDVNYHAAPTGKPAPAAPQAPVSDG